MPESSGEQIVESGAWRRIRDRESVPTFLCRRIVVGVRLYHIHGISGLESL